MDRAREGEGGVSEMRPEVVLHANFIVDPSVPDGISDQFCYFASRPEFKDGKLIALHLNMCADGMVQDILVRGIEFQGKNLLEYYRYEPHSPL